MPGVPQRDEYTEFDACCSTMRRFQINTKKRAAAWFGNLAKESGELYYTEEIASGAAYEGRRDLGNVRPGDGVRFKGRGYIQITGRANYTRIERDLKIPCLQSPELLERMPHRWTTAGYYWRHMSSLGNLNLIADKGNFARTVLGVRGGPDSDRHKYYERAMRVLPADLVIPEPQRGEKDEKPMPKPRNKDGWHPGGGDPLPPPGFTPKKRNPRAASYVGRHPTRYFLREDIAELARLVYREFGGPNKLHICTYEEHPPNGNGHGVWLGIPTERLSLDVWGPEGRGDPLNEDLHAKVWDFLFNRAPAPDIWWAVSRGRMWVRNRSNGVVVGSGTWFGSPAGAPDSDPGHWHHPHLTFLSLAEQRVLRPNYTVG